MAGQIAPRHWTRNRWLTAAVATAVAVSGIVAVRVWGQPDASSAAVVLSDLQAATVLDHGSAHAAHEGEVLPHGGSLRTGRGGRATLTVLTRRVVLGEGTLVVVPDGARVALLSGALLVDRRRGPDLQVSADQVVVDRVTRGAFTVERAYTVAVRVLSGGARVSTVTRRRLSVSPLEQVLATHSVLPAGAAPLALRHDAWERQVIPDVVREDEVLDGFARGIDQRLGTVAQAAVPAVYRAGENLPPGDDGASELVLPVAIGRASGATGDATARISRARSLRAENGSWAVVARLLAARLADVAPEFADLLGLPSTAPTPTTGGVPATPAPGGSPSGPLPTPQGSATGTPGPTDSPSVSPSGSASTSPSPTSTGAVDDLVNTITSLLPVPLPSPSPLLTLPLKVTPGPLHL